MEFKARACAGGEIREVFGANAILESKVSLSDLQVWSWGFRGLAEALQEALQV